VVHRCASQGVATRHVRCHCRDEVVLEVRNHLLARENVRHGEVRGEKRKARLHVELHLAPIGEATDGTHLGLLDQIDLDQTGLNE